MQLNKKKSIANPSVNEATANNRKAMSFAASHAADHNFF